MFLAHTHTFIEILGGPYITANAYCKSRNLPNTDIGIYSIDLRSFLRHPVYVIVILIPNKKKS